MYIHKYALYSITLFLFPCTKQCLSFAAPILPPIWLLAPLCPPMSCPSWNLSIFPWPCTDMIILSILPSVTLSLAWSTTSLWHCLGLCCYLSLTPLPSPHPHNAYTGSLPITSRTPGVFCFVFFTQPTPSAPAPFLLCSLVTIAMYLVPKLSVSPSPSPLPSCTTLTGRVLPKLSICPSPCPYI